MASPDIAQEKLVDHVKASIQKWRNNEIEDPVLSSSKSLLQHGEAIPKTRNMQHRFNRFLDFVAEEIAKTYGDDHQRSIYLQLRKSDMVNIWHKLILQEMSASKQVEEKEKTKNRQDAACNLDDENPFEEETNLDKPKTTILKKRMILADLEDENPLEEETGIGKNPNEMEKRRKRIKLDDLEDEILFEEETDLDKPQNEMERRRVKFEMERDAILESVPKSVKARFCQIYFGKSGKCHSPCLVMNPYAVPPRPLREQWLSMRKNAQNRLESMSNLVYWYGTSKDMANAYSFLPTSRLMPYEKGVAKKMDRLPKGIQKKLNDGGRLSCLFQQRIEELEELKIDLKKEPSERSGCVVVEFKEEWECEEEGFVEREKPAEKGKKAKKVHRKKRKKDLAMETMEAAAEVFQDLSKKKRRKGKTKRQPNEVAEFFGATLGTRNEAVEDPNAPTHDAATKVTQNTAKSLLLQHERVEPSHEPEVDPGFKFAMGRFLSETEDGEVFEIKDGGRGAAGDDMPPPNRQNPRTKRIALAREETVENKMDEP